MSGILEIVSDVNLGPAGEVRLKHRIFSVRGQVWMRVRVGSCVSMWVCGCVSVDDYDYDYDYD